MYMCVFFNGHETTQNYVERHPNYIVEICDYYTTKILSQM